MNSKVKTGALCFLILMALAPAAVYAENIYQAVMLPSLVVPACGENAYGTAVLIISDDGSRGAYTVNFGGLEGAQTAAMLMNAPEGTNGPMLLELPIGTPVAGTIDMTPALTAALIAGDLAIQINSTDWTAGVLRGNFVWVAVATEEATWSSVKALFE
jgi:hypothetical protein